MPRSSLAAALAWLAAALFALGAWLALPRPRGTPGPPVHALLVDTSASAVGVGRPLARLRAVLEERAREARRAGLEPLRIDFGHGARRVDLADDLGAAEDRSDLAAALELCGALAGSRLREVEILGDGTWSGADPTAAAARLAAGGARIRAVATGARRGHDAYVAPIPSPIHVRRGAPLRVEVDVWCALGARDVAASPRDLVVTATLAEGGTETERAQRLPVASSDDVVGSVRVAFEFPALASNRALLVVRAELRGEDGARVSGTPAGDAVSRAEVLAEGTIAVGLLGDAGARGAFASAVGAANADLAFVELDALPGSLDGIDVLATLDAGFDAESALAIDAFVAAGGGWIDCAGERFAGGARPRSSALVPAAEDERPREIVVLVDASGSMAGDPARAARTALAGLVEGARVEDGLSARWFAADTDLELDLGRPGERSDAARRRAALERVASVPEPRGPTRIWSALEALARDVDERARTLAILVSDGRDPDRADVSARAARVRAAFAARGAELTVIAVGADPDRELLAALAGGEALVLDAGDLGADRAAERLARLFASALASGRIVEDPGARAAEYAGGGDPIVAPFSALSRPTATRRVRARATDGAAVVWTAGAGAPLLAFARRGLGVAGGFAYPPDARWVRVPEDLWAPLATAVRAVAPPAGRARARLVEREGELVLEGASDATPAIVRAELRGARDEDLGHVDLLAARAGRDPLRERSAPLPAALASLGAGEVVRARLPGAGPDGGPLELRFAAPRAPEFARLPRAFVAPPAALAAADPAAPGPHPAGHWVLLTGLVALAAAAGMGLFSRSRP